MKVTTSDRLKELMAKRGLRQADILEMIQPFCREYGVKIQRNALSQYITGKVLPRQDKLTILGMALGVSEAWLMGFDVPMERDSVRDDADADNLHDLDAQTLTAIRLLASLPDSKKQEAMSYLRYLASHEDNQ